MAPGDHFVCVQSVVADGHGNLWVLDPAAPGNEKVIAGGPKLVRIELASNKVAQIIRFGEDVALQGSYLNDVRFDLRRGGEPRLRHRDRQHTIERAIQLCDINGNDIHSEGSSSEIAFATALATVGSTSSVK